MSNMTSNPYLLTLSLQQKNTSYYICFIVNKPNYSNY